MIGAFPMNVLKDLFRIQCLGIVQRQKKQILATFYIKSVCSLERLITLNFILN